MQLLSVNVGKPEPIERGRKIATTGIFKRPAVAPVRVTKLGLVGDAVIEKRHHGGPDQAVYVYGEADYAWWSRELGRPLEPGTFGDNLTFGGLESAPVRIGDRFHVGDTVVLEVTAPRIPCSTLAARMGDDQFVKRFRDAERPGLYCRVIAEGEVAAGMAVRHVPTSEDRVTALEVFRSYFDKGASEALVRRILDAPVAVRARRDYERRLEAITAGGA